MMTIKILLFRRVAARVLTLTVVCPVPQMKRSKILVLGLRTHIGAVNEGLQPVGTTQAGTGEKCEREREAERNSYGLTQFMNQ